MRKTILAALVGGLLAAAGTAADKKSETVVDPKNVGPDYGIQGEYAGAAGEVKYGAQVVALGKNEFDVRFLAGGLPGDGWDGKTAWKAKAKLEDGKASVVGKDFKGVIADGKLAVEIEGKSAVTLNRVERQSPTLGKKPPEGAVVLFDGTGVEKWNNGKIVELSDGKYLGVGTKTKQAFKDSTIHLEFRLAYQPTARGQGRSNSGLYLQDRYEVQLLDSFGLKGENNECGGIYQQYAPTVNMCFPPLTWQTYDIDFTAAKFDKDGKKTEPARATITHNGVVIQKDIAFKGPTGGGQDEKDTPGVFQLQNHGDTLVFRNIWVVERK